MEIAWADQRILSPVVVVGSGMFQPKTDLPRITQRQMTCRCYRGHTRQVRKTIKQFLLYSLTLGWIGIAGIVEQSAHYKYSIRIESKRRFQAVQQQIWSVDKDLPLYNTTTLAKLVSESLAQRRFTVLLLGSFAIIAVILAATGLFGVISYLVAERTREFGVRMALGAERSSIYWQVLKRAGALAIGGCGFGLVLSLFASRLLQTSLYQVSRFDWPTIVVVPSLLLGVALFAAYWPARRATKVDPMVALRYE